MNAHTSSFTGHRDNAIRIWLYAVALLVFALIVVGGATRLTESGLSIVEWKPVTGTLPPLTESEWLIEFEKYKAIPQYQLVNRGMSLADFKTIFWWEWAHRLLGRLVGVAFLLPFLWFLWRGRIMPGLRVRFWTIFGLGALQGAVGWWMVASGLVGRTEVSQYRLATHLTLACLIFALILGTAERLAGREQVRVCPRLRMSALAIIVLVLVQIYLGALVAGLRAGLIYNTWPLIDGEFLPPLSKLLFRDPVWRNYFENPLTVQFDHRMVAYLLWAFAILHAGDIARTLRGSPAWTGAFTLALAVTAQAVFGILTLVYQVPIWLALAHQAMAIVVLAIAVVHAGRLTGDRPG
jgi:cytochrome c oxidase assembly protein subunit 15